MDRMRAPTEFGFTTPSYVPPERPRALWRTLLFGALLALIPIVGPSVRAVYVDRRQFPGTFEFPEALKSAVLQVLAVAMLALVAWIVLGVFFGLKIQFGLHIGR